jgi:hypothetical protein
MVDEAPDNVIGRGRFPPNSGGSGPYDPGTEARVAKLEAAVDEIRADVKAIRLDLPEIKGKLSNVPTTFQLVFMQAALILAIFAGAFGLSKLASSH